MKEDFSISLFEKCFPLGMISHQNKIIRLKKTISGKISNSLQERHVLGIQSIFHHAIGLIYIGSFKVKFQILQRE